MLTNAKHNAFIAEWLTNGHNASEAYKKAYPNTKNGWNKHSSRLMAKDGIRQEIARKQALLEVKTEFTLLNYQQQLREDRDMAIELKQPSACVSASVAMGRSCGFDKDVQGIVEQPLDLTPEQHAEAVAAGNRANEVRITKTA